MGAWGRLQRDFPESAVIFAVQQLDPEVQAYAAAVEAAHSCQPPGMRVLLDPQGQTAQRYNALWLPRAYALDERGCVAYVQPQTTPDSHAPLEVRRLWRRMRDEAGEAKR